MRQPITLKIKFKSASLDQFIERYSVDVSQGGIFIRTKEPLPVGTNLKFEFQLQDSSQLIAGEGTVVWTRDHDPSRAGVAPGMGVRFDKLVSASGGVLDQIIAEKTRRGEGAVESRFDAGVRASAAAMPSPSQNLHSMRSLTPLPSPQPGLEQGAAEEFGQESTRVMQDEVVQRLAEKTRDQAKQAAKDEPFSDEPTRARSADEIDHLLRASSASSPSEDAATRQVPVVSSTPPPAVATVDPLAKTALDTHALEPSDATRAEIASPVVATPLEAPLRGERPPARPQRSSLAVPLIVGVVVAAAIGAYIYTSKDKGTEQQGGETAVTPTAAPVVAPQPATPTPPPEPAKPAGPSIAVTSEPPGAQVSVDGTVQPSPTPTTLEGLDPKKSYDLLVTLKGFHDWTGKLTPTDGGKVAAVLVANEKIVSVTSTPTGADVLVDGKKVGRTPFDIPKFDVAKEHQIEVRRADFEPQTRAVSANDAWEAKDGKDVLALALTLTALPPKSKAAAAAPAKHASKPAAADAPTPAGAAKPVADKPAEDKPAAVDKSVEKPADKPAKSDKPEDDRAIKTPDFMKGGAEGGENQ